MKIDNSFQRRRATKLLLALSITTPRTKIDEVPHNPAFIQTIRDIGYRFEAPP